MSPQIDLSSVTGLGVFEGDSTPLLSPLDGFTEYPMEQNELEYFESQFGDTLNDFVKSQQEVLESPPTPPTPSEDPPPYQLSFYDSSDSDSHDATSLLYNSDEPKPFAKDFSSFNGLTTLGSFDTTSDVGIEAIIDNRPSTTATFNLEGGIKYEFVIKNELDSPSMYSPPSSEAGSPRSNNPFDCSSSDIPAALRLKPEENEIFSLIKAPPGVDYRNFLESPSGNGKGKISALQRRALDTIFSVTEQPSRGLVLHIAQELGLHHLTVKNFFSNSRRRLRRAVARVQDPERTQRENQKRKEKRRMAAMTTAVNDNNNDNSNNTIGRCVVTHHSSEVRHNTSSTSQNNNMDTNTQNNPPQISPKRRALMEKLASKVQRSVLQRSLQGDIPDLGQNNQQLITTSSLPFDINSTQINYTPKIELSQLTQLSNATLDLLAGSQLDFDINALDATHLDATHLELLTHLELHQPSSLDLHDPLANIIDVPFSGIDIPRSVEDIPLSGVDLANLIQNNTTGLLQLPQDPDPLAFF